MSCIACFHCQGMDPPTAKTMKTGWASCQIRKIAYAHAPGMPGTFSPPPWVSDPDMHHGTCVTHVPWCMPGSLTSSFLWIRRRGKRSRHSRRMRNLQFYISGKRPMTTSWPLSNIKDYHRPDTKCTLRNMNHLTYLSRWSQHSVCWCHGDYLTRTEWESWESM